LGWREWVGLPALHIPYLKAKIDTGAKTSCLHASKIEYNNSNILRFKVNPLQRRHDVAIWCEAPLLGIREVKSSTGHIQKRFMISTILRCGEMCVNIELTLTNRSDMGFRMLIGRQALVKHYLVNPQQSFNLGRVSPGVLHTAYGC
jgi:hypothetical protein